MSAATAAPPVLDRVRDVVLPALQRAVDELDDARLRLVTSYQLGWCDAEGRPSSGHSGKAIRPALAVVSAEAAGGRAEDGLPGAVAVELVHNFSLLHDDVMDGDHERRHRPTGWAVFGSSQAILAGNAMLITAIEQLHRPGVPAAALDCLLRATQRLISGQSDDVHFERSDDIGLDDVLHMEDGKTAALLACASSIGAITVGAAPEVVAVLENFGRHVGTAFQLVDDVLGIAGDPAVTGKSASSDLRAGKRTAPLVAALEAGTPASARLAELVSAGPPSNEADVALAASLVAEAGGIEWAEQTAADHLDAAISGLASAPLEPAAVRDLIAIATYVVTRTR